MPKPADGLWIIDAAAHTVYANLAMADILHTDVAAMLGKPSFQYLFPEDVPAAQKLFEGKRKGDPSPFHFRLRRADGSAVWVDVLGSPMHNHEGEFMGIVGTFSVSENQS